MNIDTRSGLLDTAKQVASPNCEARPPGTPIDLLVIHGISLPPGKFGGPYIEHLFTNTLDPGAHPYFRAIHDQHVSAHLLIRRDGAVIQFVPFHLCAWHAGESAFEGRTHCNGFSIGIELEGCDERPYEDAQYTTLAELAQALMFAYPGINPRRIVGHSDISPGRKADPGPQFDWNRLRILLGAPSATTR